MAVLRKNYETSALEKKKIETDKTVQSTKILMII